MWRPEHRIRIALLLFALAALCRVLVTMVEVFERTKAVQPAEFAAGEVLFSAYPQLRLALWILAGANLLLLLSCAWDARRGSVANAWLYGAAALAQGAAILDPLGTLVAGVALCAVFLRVEEGRLHHPNAGPAWEAQLRCLSRLDWRSVGARLPGIALWSALGFLLFGAAEVCFSTGRHVDVLFSRAEFQAFLELSAAGGVLASLRAALELAFVVLAIGAFSRSRDSIFQRLTLAGIALAITPSAWLTGLEVPAALLLLAVFDRWCAADASQLRRAFAPAVILAVFFGVRIQGYLFGVLIDEIAALELVSATYAALTPIAVLVAVWTHIGTCALVQRHPPQRCLHAAAAVAVAFVLPITAWLVRLFGARTQKLAQLVRLVSIGALIVLLCATWVLGELNYPILNDFSQVAQPVWAALLGVTSAALFLLLQTALLGHAPVGGRVAWLVLALLSVVSAWSWQALSQRQGPRLIAAQHAKILLQMLQNVRFFPEPVLVPLKADVEATAVAPGIFATGNYPLHAGADFYAKRKPPIFFVLWDAARADHMSFQGYERPTTPAAQRLADDAIVFERAYANATATTVSVRHLFGGRYASRHMLAKEHAPFFTGALVAHGYDRLWINVHGSDYNGVSADAFLRCQPNEADVGRAARFYPEYEEQQKTQRVIRLLDEEIAQRQERPYPADGLFFYLHCASMHFPWKLWSDHTNYGSAPADLYDNCIGHADRALGDLVTALKERGLYEDAIIVLTADHGTGLGEHGKYGGFLPYEEQIHVPLLMKLPRFEARRVRSAVASIDLAPTFVSLFEPGLANAYEGWSLLDLASGAAEKLPRRYLFALCAFEDALAAIDLETNFKLHLHRQQRYFHLYDLGSDPRETHSLADSAVERARALFDVTAGFLNAGLESYANPYHYREFRAR